MGIQSIIPSIGYFGYKLHITASTGSLIVPLSADITRADIQDNQIYPAIASSSLPQGVRYMTAADSGYDDHNLYSLSIGEDLSWYVLYQKYTIIPQATDCN